ncbi:MAG: hypothetical protein RL264_2444 [Bacteroidota bacterium]|jgi:aminoglycoside 3-N-acetyltransferase
MALRDWLRQLTPSFLLDVYRRRKKNQVRKTLEIEKQNGEIITEEMLVKQLEMCGIKQGDSLLVHSSMSKLGYLENGASTFIQALKNVLGEKGTLLMPTSPNDRLQLDYIRQLKRFEVLNSPSRLGKITEVFRTMEGVRRSWSPTEPVAAWGRLAEFYTENHHLDETPYAAHSPFAKLADEKGKIVYVGVTLDNAGTSLHVLEDAISIDFQVYFDELFEVEIQKPNGEVIKRKFKVHNPEVSKLRRCDELLPYFERDGIAQKITIGKANSWLFDAAKMREWMIKAYQEKGVTMYTPHGRA